MGLDNFIEKDNTSSDNIKSRKQINNLTLTKSTWEYLLSSFATPIPQYDYSKYTKSELKCVAQIINEELDDESPFGWKEDSTHIDELKQFRDDLVEEVNSR